MEANKIEQEAADLEAFKLLDAEYRIYISELKTAWKHKNSPPQFRDVYEVLRPDQMEQLDDHIDLWARYVTPFAEQWWRERGYGVIWPEDDSKPMQLCKL